MDWTLRSICPLRLSFLVVAMAGCTPGPTRAPASIPTRVELAANPPAAEMARVGLGFYSHLGEGEARNHEHAESFEPCAGAHLEQVEIWVVPAAAEGVASVAPVSVQVVIRGAGEGGGPGDVICERNVAGSRVVLTPTGRVGTGEGEALPAAEHRLEVPIEGTCRVEGGRRYFLTVSLERSTPEAHWLWQDGENLDSVTWSRPLGAAVWSRIEDVDSSLRIWGIVAEKDRAACEGAKEPRVPNDSVAAAPRVPAPGAMAYGIR